MRFRIPLETDKDAEALQASSQGAQGKFPAAKRTVIDGPFAESKELIGGMRAHTAAKR
jgi:hypothetical protein